MYELILTSNAKRDLQRLDAKIQGQILNKLERLCENCDEYSHKALKGRYKGQFSLPSGDYRVIYAYDRQTQKLMSSEFDIVHPSINKV